MSKRVIDVSSYQGKIDWIKVKASGVEGAILKIIRKDLSPDKQFENNWKDCNAAGMPIVGVYNYSYATTVKKARSDSQRVVSVLNGRKAKVWLDVEDKCQKGLGYTLIEIIKEYQEVIEDAGLEFGVYTGLSFYNTYIRRWEHELNCDFWIARYPSSKAMTVKAIPPVSKQPTIRPLEGWQYSSKGQVSGISGNVDMNEWYGDFRTNKEEVKVKYPVPERLLKLRTVRMRGLDVGWVQKHLIRLGFLPELNKKGKSNLDCIYGPDTAAAVKRAQEHFGIDNDSIVGANTIYVLRWN